MKHILFTLKDCSIELIDDEEFIRKLLYYTTKECKSTLLHLAVHKFEPQGVTGFAMLAESHISIHTGPKREWQCVMSLPVGIPLCQKLV